MGSLSRCLAASGAMILAVAGPVAGAEARTRSRDGRKPPKVALSCAGKSAEGARRVLSGKGGAARFEGPVACLVTLTAPDDLVVFVAEVWTTYRYWDDQAGKKVDVKTTPRSGEVSFWADAQKPFTVTLAPVAAGAGDYLPCHDFVVHARVASADGAPWTGQLVVEQACAAR